MRRREVSAALAALLSGVAARAPAQSANLPHLLVGFPAGGSVDTMARRIAEAWRGRMAETVLVEQKVGAGGRLAVVALRDAAPDGQTLLLSPSSMFTIYPHVFRRLQYHAESDVIPVAPVADVTCGFGVGPMVPVAVKTLAQFVDWARAHPHNAAFASPAAGAMPHFLGNQFERAAGIKLVHVPYRGAAPGMQDLLGGQIAAGCFILGDYLPYLASGRVRILGITDSRRSRFAPEVPTFEEQGFKGIEGVESYGLFLPPRTPAAIVERVYDLARLALREPLVTEGLAKLGFEPASAASASPADYARRLAREREQWGPIVRASGFSSED